jgi:hypothetical protein
MNSLPTDGAVIPRALRRFNIKYSGIYLGKAWSEFTVPNGGRAFARPASCMFADSLFDERRCRGNTRTLFPGNGHAVSGAGISALNTEECRGTIASSERGNETAGTDMDTTTPRIDTSASRNGGRAGHAWPGLLLCLVCIFLVWAGCDDDPASPPSDNFQRWRARNIHDYTMLQRRDCFCLEGGQTMIVTVRSDTIASVTRFADSTRLEPDRRAWYMTIEALFNKALHPAGDSVVVTYDSTYGFPATLDINPQQHPFDGGVFFVTSIAHIP